MTRLLTPTTAMATALAATSAMFSLQANAEIIEDWQFNDASGTAVNAVSNNGSNNSELGGAAANVTTDGAGNLRYSVGVDASDNYFRNSSPALGLSAGVVTLSFDISSATLAGGDPTGANVSFGLRDEDTNSDLFLLRLQKQNGDLRLQTRIGGTNTNLENFGTDTLSQNLSVTAVINLDTDLMEVSWSLGGGTVSTATGIAVNDGDFDFVRSAANTNSDDFGLSDSVSVDFLTVDYVVPEPGSMALLGLGGILMVARRRQN